MYQLHQELKDDSSKGDHLKEELSRYEETRTRIEAKLKDLEPEVTNARQFEQRKKKLQNLELKRPWVVSETELLRLRVHRQHFFFYFDSLFSAFFLDSIKIFN